MKRIANLSALRTLMKGLQSDRALLEKRIKNDVQELKESLRPRQIAVQLLAQMLSRKTPGNGSAKVTDNLFDLSSVASNVVEQSIRKWIKKIIHK